MDGIEFEGYVYGLQMILRFACRLVPSTVTTTSMTTMV